MADDEKKGASFRIGDLRRPEVRTYRKKGAEATTPASPSAGFPSIEGWLERGTVDEVVAALRPRYEALETLATRGTVREKGPAKKAMAAYERAADLFEHLFATKAALAGEDAPGPRSTGPGGSSSR